MNRLQRSRNWLLRGLASSVGQKFILGLSGLSLVGFLIVHLAGNLLMFSGAEPYNEYAEFLHANELLPLAEAGLFGMFLFHIGLAFVTSWANTEARPIPYAMKESKLEKRTLLTSAHNTMLFSGLVVLVFLIVHLMDMKFADFGSWAFGHLSPRFLVPEGETPYTHAVRVLTDPISMTVYVIGSLVLGWHLVHGFQSAFRSLGLDHPKYTPVLKQVGTLLAVVLAVGFASLPLWFGILRDR